MSALARRPGPRPRTTPTNRHTQLDQRPDADAIARLAERLFALPGVTERPSMIYAPRDEGETDVVLGLVREALSFARGDAVP